MREIKFRAWDKDNLIMRYAENDGEDSGEGPIVWELLFGRPQFLEPRMINENQDMAHRAPNQELMQYTGLKDKNGKEIYEGDVVKAGVWGAAGYYMEDVFIVEFYEGVFGGVMQKYHKEKNRLSYASTLMKLEKIEIIGNTYENPEPLEGTPVFGA